VLVAARVANIKVEVVYEKTCSNVYFSNLMCLETVWLELVDGVDGSKVVD